MYHQNISLGTIISKCAWEIKDYVKLLIKNILKLKKGLITRRKEKREKTNDCKRCTCYWNITVKEIQVNAWTITKLWALLKFRERVIEQKLIK